MTGLSPTSCSDPKGVYIYNGEYADVDRLKQVVWLDEKQRMIASTQRPKYGEYRFARVVPPEDITKRIQDELANLAKIKEKSEAKARKAAETKRKREEQEKAKSEAEEKKLLQELKQKYEDVPTE